MPKTNKTILLSLFLSKRLMYQKEAMEKFEVTVFMVFSPDDINVNSYKTRITTEITSWRRQVTK